MVYYYSLFGIFAIIVTMMVIDQNVSDFVFLLSKIIKNKVERMFWMIKFHPVIHSSPVMKWVMMRKYMKSAEQLMKEFEQKDPK